MHIILTHEQADFDALASLLGAYLINEHYVPVLPRRINRNASAFLTLYGVELPFVDPRDLPNQKVLSAILVDTQSSVSIKGMGSHTRIQVIDHHPIKPDIPRDWDVTIADVGATTTILTERLRDTDTALSSIQATLLLLGIYEDTGSLTYTRTTPRDLQASAYLLDQGAELGIANNFLNHPLSHKQQGLYDRLLENADHLHINGFTVIIGCGDAGDMQEELSSIAHKIRDLLDPDAIFLLIKTTGGVQMIARSTCDNIDVAAILREFGGGGHERAAAGLLREQSVDDICGQLIDLLPQHITPSITVSQIMSGLPQVLSPEDSVEDADQQMKRYGYEGFPVAENNKLVGLLNRRSVDRAISHNLNLSVGSIMEVGKYSVHPEDSVELLKDVVIESGWGQIPVIDPQTEEIIGIVTRTDLLKTLPPQKKIPGYQNLASRLEAALPGDRLILLRSIANVAREHHVALYIVGGFVRDLLLDRPSIDFDLVVEGDAIGLAEALSANYGGRVTSHTKFGTAKWHLPDSLSGEAGIDETGLLYIDLVTARREFYQRPSALPTVERGSIKLDLHRRDFTINTLALRLDGHHYGELHDYWGGLQDLNNRTIRVLHSLSFVDDPTRMLRAVRFEKRFDFTIEPRTLELLLEARDMMDQVSGDRIRHELDSILVEQRVHKILSRLDEFELLATIHQNLQWDEWLYSRFSSIHTSLPGDEWELAHYESARVFRTEVLYIIWLMRLSKNQAKDVIKRLKLPVKLANAVTSACELWSLLPKLHGSGPSVIVSELETYPPIARYAIYLAVSSEESQQLLDKYARIWRNIDTSITGDDLKSLGLTPSPAYRYILKSLRASWLDGEISTTEQEARLLDQLIESLDNVNL